MWVPLWDLLTKRKTGKPKPSLSQVMPSAGLLGFAMVARGEIGLLIVEIGYNSTPYVSDAGFFTAVWAILLNTIIGPMVIGLLIKFKGKAIGDGHWGIQNSGHSEKDSRPQSVSPEQTLEEGYDGS